MDTSRIIYGRSDPEKRRQAQLMRQQMTSAESTLWECLRAGRLGGLRFRRQQVLDGFIVDFYCHGAGLVVEVDGAVHEEQQEYDVERDAILGQRGLVVLRFRNEEVLGAIDAVLNRIGEAVRTAAYPRSAAQTDPSLNREG